MAQVLSVLRSTYLSMTITCFALLSIIYDNSNPFGHISSNLDYLEAVDGSWNNSNAAFVTELNRLLRSDQLQISDSSKTSYELITATDTFRYRSYQIEFINDLLQSLRPYASAISSMTLPEAKKFFDELKLNESLYTKIGGLSIEKRYIFWVSPAVVLILYIYFFLHLGKLMECELDKEFAFIPLYDNTLSQFITMLILYVPPTLVFSLLWIDFLTDSNWPDTAYPWMFPVYEEEAVYYLIVASILMTFFIYGIYVRLNYVQEEIEKTISKKQVRKRRLKLIKSFNRISQRRTMPRI